MVAERVVGVGGGLAHVGRVGDRHGGDVCA